MTSSEMARQIAQTMRRWARDLDAAAGIAKPEDRLRALLALADSHQVVSPQYVGPSIMIGLSPLLAQCTDEANEAAEEPQSDEPFPW
jgi:hypothetical protein